MPSRKVIGFDLDGTLLDSIQFHINTFLYISKKFKLNIKKKNVIKEFSNPAQIILKKLVPSIKDETINEFIETRNRYFVEHADEIKSFPDVTKTLTQLKKKYKIILISNTSYQNILRSLEGANLNPFFFDLIVSCDIVNKPKPSADEIFIAEKTLHHDLDYYVGDSVVDMKAGLNAKVKTIGVTTGLNSKEELSKYKPYAIINKIQELLKVLK